MLAAAVAAIVAIAVVLVPFLVLYPKWTTKDVSLDLPVLLETTLRLDPFIQARDSLDVRNTPRWNDLQLCSLSRCLALSSNLNRLKIQSDRGLRQNVNPLIAAILIRSNVLLSEQLLNSGGSTERFSFRNGLAIFSLVQTRTNYVCIR